MKKLFVTVVVLSLALVMPAVASAQVSWGLKGGINLARVSGTDDDTDRIGTVGGVFLTTNQDLFAVQPEVIFSMQGADFSLGTAKVDYIQVPVLLRIGSSAKNDASVYGLIGPSVGIRISDQGWDDSLKGSDVGIVVGAGFTLSRVLVEGRFTAGLTEFSRGAIAYKHRVVSLMAGVVF